MIFYVCTIGAIVGSISGLVPGIHVNTLAALILVFNDTLESLISIIVPDDYAPVMLACMVVSAAVVHSATDFIPSPVSVKTRCLTVSAVERTASGELNVPFHPRKAWIPLLGVNETAPLVPGYRRS